MQLFWLRISHEVVNHAVSQSCSLWKLDWSCKVCFQLHSCVYCQEAPVSFHEVLSTRLLTHGSSQERVRVTKTEAAVSFIIWSQEGHAITSAVFRWSHKQILGAYYTGHKCQATGIIGSHLGRWLPHSQVPKTMNKPNKHLLDWTELTGGWQFNPVTMFQDFDGWLVRSPKFSCQVTPYPSRARWSCTMVTKESRGTKIWLCLNKTYQFIKCGCTHVND